MPAGNFKVKADGSGIARALARLKDSFSDMRPVLNNSARELTRRIQYRFTFKRDPDGRTWAPWAPSTAKRYAKDPGRKLMLHTRHLRDGTRFVAGTRDIRAVLGTPYGVFHEQPNGGGSGKLPRRGFLFSTRNGRRALAKSDEDYLLNALRYQIRKAAQQ